MKVTTSDTCRGLAKVFLHVCVSGIDEDCLVEINASARGGIDTPVMLFSKDGAAPLAQPTRLHEFDIVLPMLDVPINLNVRAAKPSGEHFASERIVVRPLLARIESVKNSFLKNAGTRRIRNCDQRKTLDRLTAVFDRIIVVRQGNPSYGILTGTLRIPQDACKDGVQLRFFDSKMNTIGSDLCLFPATIVQDASGGSKPLAQMAFSVKVPLDLKGLVMTCTDAQGKTVPGFASLEATLIQNLQESTACLFEPAPGEPTYADWLLANSASEGELARQRQTAFASDPNFSIVVPLFKTPLNLLHEMVDSVRAQSYANWQLVLVNASPDDQALCDALAQIEASDERITLVLLKENLGITLNTAEGIDAATGDFIGFLDHDDLLVPEALFECARVIDEQPDIDLLYSDEGLISAQGEPIMPYFKVDYSPDRLRNNNYFTHFTVVRASLLRTIPLRDKRFDGAQDYNMVLRVCEMTDRIHHVPKVLYHWRVGEGSTAGNSGAKDYANEAGRLALQEHLDRQNIKATVENGKRPCAYHVRYSVVDEPLVSIIIPTKDQSSLLKQCIDSILQKSTYSNFEIILVENNSTQPETFRYYEELESNERIHVSTWEGEGFNFSSLIDFGVEQAQGDYLLFLNNDTEIITPDWIEQLLGNAQRPEVGAVGCMLLYPNDTVQHAGVVLGEAGANHVRLYMPKHLMEPLSDQCNWSAVTGACLMTKRSVFQEVGGFDPEFAVAYNDVDYCLKLGAAGYLVVYTPYVELYHYESISRGYDSKSSGEKRERFVREDSLLRNKWAHIYAIGDPYMGYHWNRVSPYVSYFHIEPIEMLN